MRLNPLCVLLAVSALSACASPMPPKADDALRIPMSYLPGELLMAGKLDGQRWHDGRYVDLSPGQHELEVKLQFERASGGGLSDESETIQVTCHYRLHYDFQAGQQYRVHGQKQGWKGYVRLLDEQGQVLARGKELRCGAF